jgi:quinol monooxygenase YgiN
MQTTIIQSSRVVRAWLLMSFIFCSSASAQENARIVRLARIRIDPVHLEAYKTALKEEIEASVHLEPEVLSLEAVSAKGKPDEVTILEVYGDAEAYRSHLESPHFKKYKAATQTMVRSLELLECDPLVLATKGE